jgi:hypothetical protein
MEFLCNNSNLANDNTNYNLGYVPFSFNGHVGE